MEVLVESDARGVVRVTLNRPQVHNAFNEDLIEALTDTFANLAHQDGVRVIVLAGNGPSFSAGADLNWMRRAAEHDEEENREDAHRLARLFQTIDTCPKPVIGLIQGAALGGGVGLAACCDIAIAQPDAKFGLTEVRLGLIPAVISPYVIGKIGRSAARRYFLTGELFSAEDAHRIGLVHEVTSGLEAACARLVDALLKGGPLAIADAKSIVAEPHLTVDLTAHRIAARRASEEGRDGIVAFLEKRKPGWQDVQ